MSLFYYGSQLSPNLTETPEGFLICLNVPIARTGDMKYTAAEIGLNTDSGSNNIVTVTRNEADVFDLAVLASFEGKPVTDGHPPENVTSTNHSAYEKGHIQNVRRGTGEHSDKIIADLHIKDANLISAIKNNLRREVSCGYSCDYTPNDNGSNTTYSQKSIRGNHVAIVDTGRAGRDVRINDSIQTTTQPTSNNNNSPTRRKPLMSEGRKGLLSTLNLFGRSAKDAQTTEELQILAETAATAIENQSEPQTIPPAAPTTDNTPADLSEVMTAIKTLSADIAALKAGNTTTEPPQSPDALDTLITELTTITPNQTTEPIPAADNDESATIINDQQPINDAVISAISNEAITGLLKDVRPAIAAIKDETTRQAVVDAISAPVKGKQTEDTAKVIGARILDAVSKAAASSTTPHTTTDKAIAQQGIYDSLNPHKTKCKGDTN